MIQSYLHIQSVSGCFALAIFSMGLSAQAQTVSAPSVPADLKVPVGHTAYLKGQAVGTQNYVCLPTATGLAWKFQGPQATLFIKFRWFGGEVQQQITTHFLSPGLEEAGTPARATWQSSLDTSIVWAKKIAESSDPNYVAEGAIPWFLLQATSTRPGLNGTSMLSNTTYIQRVNTTGGMTPPGACTEAGAIQFVAYTADYVFYRHTDK